MPVDDLKRTVRGLMGRARDDLAELDHFAQPNRDTLAWRDRLTLQAHAVGAAHVIDLHLAVQVQDRVAAAAKTLPKFEIIATNLSIEEEKKLHAAFGA